MDDEHKTRSMRQVEERFGEDIEELLRRLYVAEGLSIRRVARRLRRSESTVWNWLYRLEIPTRQWRLPGDDEG